MDSTGVVRPRCTVTRPKPRARQPAHGLLDPAVHLRIGDLFRDDHSPLRRQHLPDDVPLRSRRRPERPHTERDDDVEQLPAEVDVGERRRVEPNSAGLDRRPITPRRCSDHRRRTVNAYDDAGGQPVGEQRDEDPAPTANFEDSFVWCGVDDVRRPDEALARSHGTTSARRPALIIPGR
jgi:hypothetical protein